MSKTKLPTGKKQFDIIITQHDQLLELITPKIIKELNIPTENQTSISIEKFYEAFQSDCDGDGDRVSVSINTNFNPDMTWFYNVCKSVRWHSICNITFESTLSTRIKFKYLHRIR